MNLVQRKTPETPNFNPDCLLDKANKKYLKTKGYNDKKIEKLIEDLKKIWELDLTSFRKFCRRNELILAWNCDLEKSILEYIVKSIESNEKYEFLKTLIININNTNIELLKKIEKLIKNIEVDFEIVIVNKKVGDLIVETHSNRPSNKS